MALDLSSLRRSVDALQRAIDFDSAVADSVSGDGLEVVRAGVVQHFEVAYEQCWKFIQRWIRENREPEDADHRRTRKDLFRAAARYGLIPDPVVWFSYGDARNLTSHMYDQRQANEVYEIAKQFAPDARALLDRLESLND